MAKESKQFFWASYADLMTSLFFVMLALFVLALVLLNNRLETTKAELDQINEINQATQNLDPRYFEYDHQHKKHKLKVEVRFGREQVEISTLNKAVRSELLSVGRQLNAAVDKAVAENPKIKFLLIIEGQASWDSSRYNYEISYNRALELMKYWHENNINFNSNCEVLICGSGDGTLPGTGHMREEDNEKNQRFLIHLMPKPGMLGESE